MMSMMCMNPIRSFLSVGTAFHGISKTESFVAQQGLYLLVNAASMGLAVYKAAGMGIIPSTQADWLEFMTPAAPAQLSAGGLI